MSSIWTDLRGEQKRRLREHIVQVAVQLAGEQGIAATSMSQLAERAGISRATLYNYFPDFEHALLAYVSDEVERYHEHLLSRLGDLSNPLDRLREYVRSHLDYFAGREHRLGVEHLERSGLSPKALEAVHARVDILRAVLAHVLRDARDQGLVRADADIELQAALTHGLLVTAREWLLRQERSPAVATDEILNMVLRGLSTGV